MLVEEVQAGPEPVVAENLRSHAVRAGGILIGCRWLAQVLSWGVTLGVARLLSPEDYGVMAAAALLLGLSDLFAEAGVGRALVQKAEVTASDYAHAFTLSLLLSIACYLVLLVASGPAARFLRTPELKMVLPVMGALILLVPFRTVPLGILDRRLEMKSQGLVHMISTALQASTVLSLAFLGAGYWALVVGSILARVFESLALARLTGWRPQLRFSLRGARDLLKYGAWVSGGSFLWYFYSNSDYAVVGRLEGPIVLGYYSLAFQLMSLPVQKLTANINQISFPVFCRLQGDLVRVKRWYLRLNVLMMAVILPTLLGAALVARDGIGVAFGTKWLPTVLPFQLLCVVGLLSVITTSLVSLLNALGRPDINFKYTATCAVVFPISFGLAGKSYGVIGVCVAWVLVYSVVVVVLLLCTRRVTSIGFWELISAHLPTAIAGAFMAVCVLGLQAGAGSSAPAVARLVAAIGVGVVSFAGSLWLIARETVIRDLVDLWKTLKGRGADALVDA